MIVRREGNDLVLLTQPNHAALSGRLMDAWRRDGLPAHPARETILLATREHDNGWLEVDREPLLDAQTGRPFDFVSVPDEVKQPIWPRATRRVGAMSPLAGALVAQHALTVLSRHHTDPSWIAFFDALRKERSRLTPTDVSQDSLDDAYRFVYLGDLLSLIFCNGWTESFGAYGYRITLRGSRLQIAPDPFDGRDIPLHVPARRIAATRYDAQADLSAAFAAAEPIDVTGTAGAA